MNEEQKAQALALCGIPEVGLCMDRGWLPYVWVDIGIRVPDLAHPSGAVEGVLHHVLARLAGEDVEVVCSPQSIKPPPDQWVMEWSCIRVRWRSMSAHGPSPRFTPIGYPTSLEAIVAALLAIGAKP